MKKVVIIIIAVAVALFVLIAGIFLSCSRKEQAVQPAPTIPQQQTPAETQQPDGEPAAPTAEGDTSALLEEYYAAKAQEKLADVKKDKLEQEFYAGGQTDQTAFREQRAALEQQEREWENKADELELQLRVAGTQLALPEVTDTQNASALLQQMREVEDQQDLLELEEKQLERRLLNGDITEEEFLSQQTEYERQGSLLDAQENQIERYLERLGVDD